MNISADVCFDNKLELPCIGLSHVCVNSELIVKSAEVILDGDVTTLPSVCNSTLVLRPLFIDINPSSEHVGSIV